MRGSELREKVLVSPSCHDCSLRLDSLAGWPTSATQRRFGESFCHCFTAEVASCKQQTAPSSTKGISSAGLSRLSASVRRASRGA